MLSDNDVQTKLRGKLLRNEPLAEYTSWRVGGVASEGVYIPADLADTAQFLRTVPTETPLLWLGLGSNTLVRDGGIDGFALITQGALAGITQVDELTICAEAGVACAQLARYSARLGLTGLEFLAGIPGTVGGALAMNAGCYGGETWQGVMQVQTIDRQGECRIRKPNEYKVGYRHVKGPEEWFAAGYFTLAKSDKKIALETIKTMLEKRNAAQPTSWPNGGSVFRNPAGFHAAKLIEQAGLKGLRIGQASVSEKHANFIINEGNARASDIEQLILQIIDSVKTMHGIELVPEVRILGR